MAIFSKVIERNGQLIHHHCKQPVFNGCKCYLGEWKCLDCGEYTFPFSGLEFSDGCIYCGSVNVRKPPPDEALAWREHLGMPW